MGMDGARRQQGPPVGEQAVGAALEEPDRAETRSVGGDALEQAAGAASPPAPIAEPPDLSRAERQLLDDLFAIVSEHAADSMVEVGRGGGGGGGGVCVRVRSLRSCLSLNSLLTLKWFKKGNWSSLNFLECSYNLGIFFVLQNKSRSAASTTPNNF